MVFMSVIGFFLGMVLPVIASRFGKIIPADPGMILLKLPHIPHFPSVSDVYRTRLLRIKWLKLLFNSVIVGALVSFCFTLGYFILPPFVWPWMGVFVVINVLCLLIDFEYYLLPDFFTIPMLILGFIAAEFGGILPIEASLVGAVVGYLIPVVSVFTAGLFMRSEFGAGDTKMISALGAWLGATGMGFLLFLSFLLFSAQMIVQEKRSGAFGPALAVAGIITFFIIYAK